MAWKSPRGTYNNTERKQTMVMEKNLDWKLLKREQLFKDKWADIRIDTCEKADGSIITPFIPMLSQILQLLWHLPKMVK